MKKILTDSNVLGRNPACIPQMIFTPLIYRVTKWSIERLWENAPESFYSNPAGSLNEGQCDCLVVNVTIKMSYSSMVAVSTGTHFKYVETPPK